MIAATAPDPVGAIGCTASPINVTLALGSHHLDPKSFSVIVNGKKEVLSGSDA